MRPMHHVSSVNQPLDDDNPQDHNDFGNVVTLAFGGAT